MVVEILCLILGTIIGGVITKLLDRRKTGYGFFKIDTVPDEEDFYTINVRLDPDQKLNEKKQIVLTRE